MFYNGFVFTVTLLLHAAFGNVITIDSLLKHGDLVSSLVIDSGQLTKASDRCLKQWELMKSDLTQEWVLRLIDASSKIPSGLLIGNLVDTGNFDACLAIEHETNDDTILGKYCGMSMIINLPIGGKTAWVNNNKIGTGFPDLTYIIQQNFSRAVQNVPLVLSLCLPDACNPSDMQNLVGKLPIQFVDGTCQTKNTGKDFDGYDIMNSVLFAIGFAGTVFSTTYDYYMRRNKKKPKLILTAFSIISNGKKLFSVNRNSPQLQCLNGIRVLSMLWVITGHRFAGMERSPHTNFLLAKSWMDEPYSQYVRGAHFAVDTFLYISGLLMAYSFLKKTSRINLKMVLMMYVHRYLRLTPALLALYLFVISWYRHLGSGPFWPVVENYAVNTCRKWWWSVFLYVQNYVNLSEVCMIHTWYLSMDMQIFLLSPLVMVPVVNFKKWSLYYLGVCIAASMAVVAAVTYIYETQMFTQDYYDYYYYLTHTRFAPWLIGILFGIILVKYEKKPFKISWATNMAIWAVVIASFMAMVFTGTDIQNNYKRVQTTVYLTLSRPALAVMLSWIIFACSKGYGGIVNWFLSSLFFQSMAKLTYSMYLLHFVVIMLQYGTVRAPGYFSDFVTTYVLAGDVVFTALLAIIWSLLFESPIIIIEKVLFGEVGKPAQKNPPTQENPNNVNGNNLKRITITENDTINSNNTNGNCNNGSVDASEVTVEQKKF